MPSHRPPSARKPQAAQWSFARLGLLLAASAALAGCAVPGEPIARHPVVPEPVKDLTAQQRGDAVVLSFTLPKNSTDQKPLGAVPTAEVYRSTLSSTSSAAPPSSRQPKPAPHLADTIPSSVLEASQKNGRAEVPDPLDHAVLAQDPGQQITYFVRTRASAKRESANSNAVTVAVFPAPPAISGLHATVTEDAILLSWTAVAALVAAPSPAPRAAPVATPTVIGYRVYRAEVAPTAGIPPATQGPAKTASATSLELLGQPPQAEYRDTTFEIDHSYSYMVRSVAQFGSVIVESADSMPLVVFAKDTFAPGAPQGLETVIVPETPGVPAYVELAWNISPEPDLAGYIVFRGEQSDTMGTRLTSELLSVPTFRDMTVVPGQHYFYRVAAVDHDGNVSPLSSAAEADVP